jgi:hypothetical protein
VSASTIPTAMDALVAAARRALPDVQVWDGEPTGDLDGDLVCIGFAGEQGDDTAVESTRTRDQMAVEPDHEQYVITSVAYSWLGDQEDARAVRDRVYAMVDAIAADLAADPTMGGVVGRARIATDALAQAQTEKGATAAVRFTVTVDAWTR